MIQSTETRESLFEFVQTCRRGKGYELISCSVKEGGLIETKARAIRNIARGHIVCISADAMD